MKMFLYYIRYLVWTKKVDQPISLHVQLRWAAVSSTGPFNRTSLLIPAFKKRRGSIDWRTSKTTTIGGDVPSLSSIAACFFAQLLLVLYVTNYFPFLGLTNDSLHFYSRSAHLFIEWDARWLLLLASSVTIESLSSIWLSTALSVCV